VVVTPLTHYYSSVTIFGFSCASLVNICGEYLTSLGILVLIRVLVAYNIDEFNIQLGDTIIVGESYMLVIVINECVAPARDMLSLACCKVIRNN
jgi:hypothetical protein